MQPITVEDMVRLLVGALENGDSDGKILSLGGPDILPLSDIVSKVTYACGHPPPNNRAWREGVIHGRHACRLPTF